ncbi:MAG: hypothetical protein ACE5HC_15195 [Candidatus Binatia bacterium]
MKAGKKSRYLTDPREDSVKWNLLLLKTTYAKTLRAVGQVLEELPLKGFELKSYGNDYLIWEALKGPLPKKARILDLEGGIVRNRWRGLLVRYPTIIRARFTPGDLDRLEREGQARRHDPTGMPDFFSLSQVMRGVGSYLDSKGICLLTVSKRRQDILTVQYETAKGKIEEELSFSTLYTVWVHAYLQRMNRQRPKTKLEAFGR